MDAPHHRTVLGHRTVLAAALVAGLTACGTDDKRRDPTGTASAHPTAGATGGDPATALKRAIKVMDSRSHRFNLSLVFGRHKVTGLGDIDPPARSGQLTTQTDGGDAVTLLALGDDRWVRRQLASGVMEPWYHLDPARLPVRMRAADLKIGRRIAAMLEQPATTQANGSNRWKGTLDLSLRSNDPMSLYDLLMSGVKPDSVTFQAEADPSGQLSLIRIDVPSNTPKPIAILRLELIGVGRKPDLSRPADAREAGADIYEMLTDGPY